MFARLPATPDCAPDSPRSGFTRALSTLQGILDRLNEIVGTKVPASELLADEVQHALDTLALCHDALEQRLSEGPTTKGRFHAVVRAHFAWASTRQREQLLSIQRRARASEAVAAIRSQLHALRLTLALELRALAHDLGAFCATGQQLAG